MKIRQINEIIDDNDDLIGADDMPQNGSDLESQANNTTDYNAKVGHQPFRYDMLGRFGFTLLPFFEGKENQKQNEMVNDLIKLLYNFFIEKLKYYYKNPTKLKNDYRVLNDKEYDYDSDIKTELTKKAHKIIKLIEKHFENAFDKDVIDENKMIEDTFVDKKDIEFSKKGKDWFYDF